VADAGTRLKRHWFHILVALAGEDAHGSAIVRDVLDQTDGALRLWPATLYGALDELVAAGWITELTGRKRPAGASERRRYYRLTPAGRRVLSVEAAQLAALAGTARDRLRRA
jgi:DNA-binding PadR family transcriptional regulator